MASAHKFIGEILRTGARLAANRNALLAGWGMTGAKLRLLKTIRQLPVPMPVSRLAQIMGVARQTVRDTAREMQADGFISFTVNLRNQRAPVVELTHDGRALLAQLMRVERRWVAGLSRGFNVTTRARACFLLQMLRSRVTDQSGPYTVPCPDYGATHTPCRMCAPGVPTGSPSTKRGR
jgi:DNA-binding MarR family transcriptional regulator